MVDSPHGSAVSLNFALRSDMGRTLTARAFEALLAGSLLVQEYTPDHDSYFVDGKHYLSFVTMEDLIDVMGFVRTHSEEAEAIRRAGHHLMRTAYGDEAIVGCFDRLIAERESD